MPDCFRGVFGGDIVYANDQMTKCISRNLADEGVIHPWYANGSVPFARGNFLYSNCDTMVLGGNNFQGYRARSSNIC
jgi:hypothetical protein